MRVLFVSVFLTILAACGPSAADDAAARSQLRIDQVAVCERGARAELERLGGHWSPDMTPRVRSECGCIVDRTMAGKSTAELMSPAAGDGAEARHAEQNRTFAACRAESGAGVAAPRDPAAPLTERQRDDLESVK